MRLYPGQKISIYLSFLFFTLLISLSNGHAQTERKSLKTFRINVPPVIDGVLNDSIWNTVEPATGFLQYEPYNNRPASFESFVWVMYDDFYMYIGARMLDPESEKILAEISLRDGGDHLNADRFWININPFDDGINGFTFEVAASEVQTDINISHGTGNNGGGPRRSGDVSWDAVWSSNARITDEGWEVEMRIPYSALRFPSTDIQQWGINFWREIRRTRETSSWNFVNREISDVVASMGLLTGIEGVRPPIRLALFPYASTYLERNGFGAGWESFINGGMDVKYGINESFTVDMTLIPDFGQVQADEKVLNLTPFEVRYDENRQFFTEGTELFNKADLFYSRRVGSRPSGFRGAHWAITENEIVDFNPIETRLINATKLSGRTQQGLGIGVFNAMTAASHAILRDTITGAEREFKTQPFTNYNLVVFDQSLKNNSFVSLVNTNVAGLRNGYTGNITGTEFRFLDKSRMFRFSGVAALSQQYYRDTDDTFGYKYNISIGKFGGTWQYNYTREAINNTYHQNDLGFLRRNNLVSDRISLGYHVFEPFWNLLNISSGVYADYRRMYEHGDFTNLAFGYTLRALWKSRFFTAIHTSIEPLGSRDYFEPRVQGRFFETGPEFDMFFRFSTDHRNKLIFSGDINYSTINSAYNQRSLSFEVNPYFRASNRLNFAVNFEKSINKNDIGYVHHTDINNIFFGLRDNTTLENEFSSNYIFNNNLSLGFDLRHYWSKVDYKDRYFLLQEDGTLQDVNHFTGVPDINFNAFTIDLRLTWNFAPGSQMTAVWQNIIESEQNELITNYFRNMRNFLDDSQINSFSIKVLYYLDYRYFAGGRRGRFISF